ncbi:MAG: hypothetical protein U0996_22135 [Planctomycetaceae bacterium]
MKNSFRTSADVRAFHKLVEILSNIPVCARSKTLEMTLTDCESPDITTQRILRAIRRQLDVLVTGAQLSHLAAEVHELDDTRNNIEVAFAVDHILRHSHVEGETGDRRLE